MVYRQRGGGLAGNTVHDVIVVGDDTQFGLDFDVTDALDKVADVFSAPHPAHAERREVLKLTEYDGVYSLVAQI